MSSVRQIDTVSFPVEGMTCAACVNRITRFLANVDGVENAELAGWAETTVIIRFWLLAAMCAALGLGLFYSEWLTASAGL